MRDRELLELAANAAGIVSNGLGDCYDMELEKTWNPLVDDGDALRLAVRLGMRVSLRQADADGGSIRAFGEKEDPYAATRRAIVKAAAEIGKTEEE